MITETNTPLLRQAQPPLREQGVGGAGRRARSAEECRGVPGGGLGVPGSAGECREGGLGVPGSAGGLGVC